MKFNSTKREEAEDGLYDRLGHAHHAGGEGGADRRAQELGVGEDAAGEYEEREHERKAGVQRRDGGADVGRFPEYHGDGDEDGEGVVAIDIQHFHNTFRIITSISIVLLSNLRQ